MGMPQVPPIGKGISMGDQAEHKAEELKGQAKEGIGKATGNEQWEAEGKADQAKGAMKQAGDKVKDAVRRLTHR
jgi:uncharacterized protein YjbJ (UPF0337 family)